MSGWNSRPRVLIGVTLGKVLLLLGFIAFAVPSIDPSRLTPILGTGPLGILGGAAVFFFAFAGYSRIATIAGEIKEPRRNIPLGITVGFAIAAAIFLLVGVVTLGVLGAQQTAPQEAPIFAPADAALGRRGGWTVLGAAWLATLSVLIGGILGVSRIALAMGAARELTIWLVAVHPRFRTPHRSVLALGLGSAVLALIFNLRPLLNVIASRFCHSGSGGITKIKSSQSPTMVHGKLIG
jgi:APA family basic amino acid/polyamine antiporter